MVVPKLNILVFGLLITGCYVEAFYVPGIAPKEFARGERIGEFLLMLAKKEFSNFCFAVLQR